MMMLALRSLCLTILSYGLAHSTASASDPVVIVAPQNGAVVPTQFGVRVTYGDITWCDTDGCTNEPVFGLQLIVDNASKLAYCSPCPPDEANFDVMLPPGDHTLQARATRTGGEESSEEVSFTVLEAATTSGTSDASISTTATTGSNTGETTSLSTGETNTGTTTSSTTAGAGTAGAGTDGGETASVTIAGNEPVPPKGCDCGIPGGNLDGTVWLGAPWLLTRRRRRRCPARYERQFRDRRHHE